MIFNFYFNYELWENTYNLENKYVNCTSELAQFQVNVNTHWEVCPETDHSVVCNVATHSEGSKEFHYH